MTRTHADYPSMVVDTAAAAAVFFVSQLVTGVVYVLLGGLERETAVLNLILYMIAGVILGCLLIGLFQVYRMRPSDYYLKRLTVGDIGYAFLGYVGAVVLFTVVESVLRLIPGLNLSERQEFGLDSIDSIFMPVVFVVFVVVAPIVEEFLFRGFLYHRLKKHGLNVWINALFVSALFGLVHGQLNTAVTTGILSLAMIWVMEKRKNIWTAVIMHALNNTVAFFVVFVFKLV